MIRRTAAGAAILVAAAGCGNAPATHRSAGVSTAPPPGWVQLFSRNGDRALYDNFGRGGSFSVAVNQQVEVVAWADGDVQHVIACLVRIDIPASPDPQCYKPVIGSRGFGVQLSDQRPQRRFYSDVPAGRYTVGVDIEGAATWHVRVYGQRD